MAKRRRCKDKLPHLAHDWGMQMDAGTSVKAGASMFVAYSPSRMRRVAQSFFCPGISEPDKEEPDSHEDADHRLP